MKDAKAQGGLSPGAALRAIAGVQSAQADFVQFQRRVSNPPSLPDPS
jgi:hypothetical protein